MQKPVLIVFFLPAGVYLVVVMGSYLVKGITESLIVSVTVILFLVFVPVK